MYENKLIGLVVFAYSVMHVACHGNMVKPYTWFDAKQWIETDQGYIYDYVGMKSGMMCNTGREITKDEICSISADPNCKLFPYPGESCLWYKNGTWIEKPTIFNPELLTYPIIPDPHYTLHHPWRAPGSAPVDSPCGVAGGNLHGCPGGCRYKAGGFGYGPKIEDFQFKHPFHVTNWTRGEAVEVGWGIVANHGGGYSYRLCKLPRDGIKGLTEKCFQQTHLRFVGDVQWVQFGEDEKTRFEFEAVRTSSGTVPDGSQWTKNPIPACKGMSGGFYFPSGECPDGTQFTPPRKDLYGYGTSIHRSNFPQFQFSIIDKVLIPKDLEPGEYVLAFRWDCEQTPQVWTSCSSVNLK